MNEISTKVKKPNIFQKIRIEFFKRKLRKSKNIKTEYYQLPKDIKQNLEIVQITLDKMISEDLYYSGSTIVMQLPIEYALKILKNNNDLIDYLSGESKLILLENLLETQKIEDYMQLLKLDLDQQISYIEMLKEKSNGDNDVLAENIGKVLKYFDEEVIQKVVEKKPKLIETLTDEQQRKLVKDYYKYCRKQIQDEYIQNIITDLKSFDKWRIKTENEDVQMACAKLSPFNMMHVSNNVAIKLFLEDPKNIRFLPQLNGIEIINSLKNIKDHEKVANIIIHSKKHDAQGLLDQRTFHGILSGPNTAKIDLIILHKLDIRTIIELGQVDNNYYLNYCGLTSYDIQADNDEALGRCKELFSQIYGKERFSEFKEIIDNIYHRHQQTDRTKTDKLPIAELKILLNPTIMRKVDDKLIKEFFNKKRKGEETQELFREIIKRAYGEKAYAILKKRPNLDEYNINSLEIFDERIMENFSEEFVNDLISYDFEGFSAFLHIIKNPETLENFKFYYDFLSEVMGKNAGTMQRAFQQFDYVSDLIADVKNVELTEKQYANLISVLLSLGNKCNISNLQELENYDEISENFMNNILKNSIGDISEIEELLGITEMEAERFLTIYDDKMTVEELKKIGLDESEICLINVLRASGIMKADKSKLFKMRNPIALHTGMRKIRERQMELFNSRLLTREKMDRAIEEMDENEPNPNIAKYTGEDGLVHYVLKGIPFALIFTRLGLSDSSDAIEHCKRFLEYDGQSGASTISASYVVSGSPLLQTVGGFVFTSPIEPDNLIGICNNDAGLWNGIRLVNPGMYMNGPISDIDNAMDLYSNKYNDKVSYNEIGFYRRNRNQESNPSNMPGRRIIPDFYVHRGPVGKELAELLKKYNIAVLEIEKEKYPIKNQSESKNEQMPEHGDDIIIDT